MVAHQDRGHKKDNIAHWGSRPVKPREEKEREADRAHCRETIRVADPHSCRDVPHRSTDESSEECADDTRDEAKAGVATETGQCELSHEHAPIESFG